MTNQDQRALSERIAILAEQAGLPSELLWIAVCPLCDNWVRYWQTTDCMECTTPWCGGEFQKERMDLTDPANLLPVVEAWRTQELPEERKCPRYWTVDSEVDYAKDRIPMMPNAMVVNEHNEDFETDGDTPWEALALALAEALEKGAQR